MESTLSEFSALLNKVEKEKWHPQMIEMIDKWGAQQWLQYAKRSRRNQQKAIGLYIDFDDYLLNDW